MKLGPKGGASQAFMKALDNSRTAADLEHQARVELNTMADALKRDAPEFFRMGKMRANKKLANGAVVTISITMPSADARGEGERKR